MRNPTTQRHARELRNAPTDAERHLWRFLRQRQMAGYRFRRQVPIGSYVADFACLEVKLVVEVDGGQHGERRGYDEVRDRAIGAQGFRIFRFWNNQVLGETDAVLEVILRALGERLPPS